MAINKALKTAFIQAGKTQSEVAQKIGIDETRLSKIVRGWRQPKLAEQLALAKVLRCPVEELFPSSQAVV